MARAGSGAGADGLRAAAGGEGVRIDRRRARTATPSGHTGRVGDVDVVATDDRHRDAPGGRGDRTRARGPRRSTTSWSSASRVGSVHRSGSATCSCPTSWSTVRAVPSTGPPSLQGVTRRGRLVSSDDFQVEDDELAQLEAAGVIALDMETAAVAAVCERHGCTWSVVRAISDMANDHPIGDAVMNLARPDGSANIPGVLKYAVTHPGKMKQLAKLGRDSSSRRRPPPSTPPAACAHAHLTAVRLTCSHLMRRAATSKASTRTVKRSMPQRSW